MCIVGLDINITFYVFLSFNEEPKSFGFIAADGESYFTEHQPWQASSLSQPDTTQRYTTYVCTCLNFKVNTQRV